jgi:hypothetical protein
MTTTIVALAFLLAVPAPASEAGPKWRWWPACETPHVTSLTIRLGGRVLHRARLRLCHLPDSAFDPGDERVAVFRFKADAKRFGDDYRHFGTRVIEGNVWEAGGDPDGIVLGISFVTADQVLLNTLHVANRGGSSRLELAPGLTSETTPFRAGSRLR